MNKHDYMIFDWNSGDSYHSRYCLSTEGDSYPNQGQIRMTYDHRDTEWSESIRGTTAMRLVDDGDNVRIFASGKECSFDYSEICEVYMLLMYYFDHSSINPDEITVSKFLPVE